jgi:murein DD-endopeptidase MepM/ murein hydrolase activator NlpD
LLWVIDCSVYQQQESSKYILPYQVGEAYKVEVSTGHYRKANGGVGLYAIDFNMPIGTTIVAARDGKVVSLEEENKDWNGKDLAENYIFIQHEDGTVARYFHLTQQGALATVGDYVKAGDVIGKSSNTGQSGGPHLHFDVQKCGPNLHPNYNKMPCAQTLPVTFSNTTTLECGVIDGNKYTAFKHVNS